MAAALSGAFGGSFQVIYPEDLTPCEQVAAFAHARVVVGQHGAALSNAAYMRDGAALIELHAVLHGVFGHLAESVGVVHVAATEAEHAELYVGDGRMFVELRAPELVELVAQTLARVDATWRKLPDAS